MSSSRTFSVNTANDIFIGDDGNLSIVTGLQSVLQCCAHAAKAQLGEMVLATDQGIPTMQTVWGGVINTPQFEAALRIAFLNVTGVLEVVSLVLSQVGDQLNYNAVIRTTFGSGAING